MSGEISTDENGQVVPSGNIHPLYNPLILETIMKWCSLRDIKSFRQVSKLWHYSSIKRFGEIGVVGKKLKAGGLENFVKFLENSELVNPEIYSNFTLRKWKSGVLQKHLFWSTCSSHIKILKLVNIEFESAEEFRQVVFGKCTRLEKLNIKNIQVKNPQSQESSIDFPQSTVRRLTVFLESDISKTTPVAGISWMEFFACVPYLKSLELDTDIWTENLEEIVENAFEAIRIIRQNNPNKLKLAHVGISIMCAKSEDTSLIYPSLTKVLLDPKLHFEYLAVGVASQEDKIKIADILQANKNSLRLLELDGSCNTSHVIPMDILLPIPNNLEECLFKSLAKISLSGVMFSSLAFLKLTPNLRKLSLYSTGRMIENTSQSEMENVRLLKCTELDLHLSSHPMTIRDIELLIGLLPNLEILRVPLDNESFSLICQRLPNLVSLSISGSELDECGLVGLDKEEIDLVNAEGENWSQKLRTVRRANIANLKHLRKLSIYEIRSNTFQKFSYCAVTLGIKEVPSLEKLYVPSPGFSKGVNWYNHFKNATGEVNLKSPGSLEFANKYKSENVDTSSDESDTDDSDEE